MSTINIKLYDILRHDLKLPDAKAKEFVEAMQQSTEEDIKPLLTDMATKDFVKKEIAEAKNDLIKWQVGLFITLALMIIGIYLKK
jgi:hypothetical protein